MKNKKLKKQGVNWLIFFLLVIVLCATVVKADNLTNGLVSYYKLDENTGTSSVDSLGKNNLTLYGALWVSGKINNSLYFNGVSNATTTQNGFSLGANTRTITFWSERNISLSRQMFMLYYGSTGSSTLNALGTLATSNYQSFVGWGADINTSAIVTYQVYDFYTMVYDGTRIQFYKNAVLTGNITNALNTGSGQFVLGGSYLVGNDFRFIGKIDEVGVWNRTLNQSEIESLYNNGVGNSYPFIVSNETNVTTDNTPIFVNQTPSDINVINAVYGVNITYNYQDTNLNVTSPYLNWSIKNITGGLIYTYVNGTTNNGYNTLTYSSYNGNNYTFKIDDILYPATYNINHNIMSNTQHYNYTLTSVNDILKVELFNVTVKNYDILEIDMVTSNSNSISPIYYCNSTYTTGNPQVNSNCALITNFNTTIYNHKHNNSNHNIIPLPIVNGNYSTVKVTSTSYFLIKGNNVGNVYVGYINQTPRSTATLLSNNNGNTYNIIGSGILADLHLHFYDINDSFNYVPYYQNTSGTFLNGSKRTDVFNITNLPPTPPSVTLNKNSFYYNETLLITRSDSIIYNTNLSYYQYYIDYINLTFYKPINMSTNASSQSWKVENISPGYYYIIVRVYDQENLSNAGISELIYIGSKYLNPCNETITLNSTGVNHNFVWQTDLLSGYTELIGYKNIFNNFRIANSTGINTLYNNTTGLYNLKLSQDMITDTNCVLNLCLNNYVRTLQPCVNDLKLVTYTDTNYCSIAYDVPSNNGTYEACITPPNTDRELWLIIFMFVFWLVFVALTFFISTYIIIPTFIISIAFIPLGNNYFDTNLLGIMLIIVTSFVFVMSIWNKKLDR